MSATLQTWRHRYERLGLATVPLQSGSKQPVCTDWQSTPPPVQWREAGDRAGNIGLRTGNGFAVADADAPMTADTLLNWLAGLGIKPPVVTTPSGGRHFYLRVADIPGGTAYCHWSADIGPGELRIGPGAQVAAPCSAVNGRRYEFERGTKLEDLLRMPALRWRELHQLVRPQKTMQLDTLPIPLPRRNLADWAVWLLRDLATHPPGAPVRLVRDGEVITYASRSEAEQAVVLHAVWRGWTFEEVAALFERHQPGHYATRHNKDAYLQLCWRKALGWFAGTPERKAIAKLWQWAKSRPWPGRGGTTESLAYQSLLQRAWLANTLTPDVSRRDVELYASVGERGAQNALKRLVNQGFVTPVGQRVRPTDARTWRLEPEIAEKSSNGQAPLRTTDGVPGGAELWGVLRPSAGLLYPHLSHEPRSISSLSMITGKHRHTVRNALKTLRRYGLATDTGAGWIVGERSVEEVAHELGVPARKRLRERQIDRERTLYREVLLWREGKSDLHC